MKRVMCLWFPNWPIQRRLAIESTDGRRTIILYGLARGKTRVVACCRAARQRGVAPGMLLAEAQSLYPATTKSACFEQHDPLADRQALQDLALWCHQFSPIVALEDVETPDSLLLEPPQSTDLLAALQRRGYWATAAIADTIGAAWGVAHYAHPAAYAARLAETRVTNIPSGAQVAALRPLPIEALRLPDDVVATLHELNLFRIDELLALPRAELPSRFGDEILHCIDRALGRRPELLKPVPPAEPLETAWDFEPPVADARILATVIEHLLERLLAAIGPRRGARLESLDPYDVEDSSQKNPQQDEDHVFLGMQQLLCSLRLANRETVRFSVEMLRPTASRRDLMDLVKLKMERQHIATEVTSVTVRAARVLPVEFQQEAFSESAAGNRRRELDGLIERLSSRLGEKAVLRPSLQPDAQPEYAWGYEPWLTATRSQTALRSEDSASRLTNSLRPIVLKKRPVPIPLVSLSRGTPFPWNGDGQIVERSWGPERIETGWWRSDDIRRDYFIVETNTGERFWIFRNLVDESWYLHGVFA